MSAGNTARQMAEAEKGQQQLACLTANNTALLAELVELQVQQPSPHVSNTAIGTMSQVHMECNSGTRAVLLP